MRATFASCLLVALVGAPGPAEATNGAKLTSYGVRAAGRGGVDYAYADDGTGPATNPAGMAWVWGNRFDQTWALADPRVSWTNQFGEQEDRENFFIPVPAFSFGAFIDPSKDWELKPLFDFGDWGLRDDEDAAQDPPADETAPLDLEDSLGSSWRLGFGVFPVTGGRVQLKKLRTPGFRDPLDWETDILSLAITPSLAVRINEFFSIGVALQFIYTRFELDGGIAQPRYLLSDAFRTSAILLSDNPQILTKADLDDAFTFGVSSRIGCMFTTRLVSVGLVYQDRTYSADPLGRATVDGTDEVNRLTTNNPGLMQVVDPRIDPSRGFVSEYDLRIQDYEQPRQFGLGVAFRPHRRVSIGVDYTFILWSEFYKKFKVRLSNGNNPNLDIMTRPTIPVRVPLDFDDQHVVALGLSLLAVEGEDIVEGVPSWALVLRTGYNYGQNPGPSDTTMPQLPTISEHHVSGGFTLHVGPLLEVSLAAEYALPNEVSTGRHRGDLQLSNSKHRTSILFLYLGIGANF